MRKRFIKEDVILIGLAIFLMISMKSILASQVKVKDKWYYEKLDASKRLEDSFKAIKEEKMRRNIKINPSIDINLTGLIGGELTPITTTSGALEAKRTTTNPNFAAVMIEYMKKAGLKEGDKIAVNFSGSFPAANLSVICAAEALNLKPIIISSVGASTYGANIPEFTYQDMEYVLFKEGLISNKSIAFSMGGAKDVGKDMETKVASEIVKRIKGYGADFIQEEQIQDNVRKRYKIYKDHGENIKAFINVGGNIVSTGENIETDIKPGLLINKNFNLNSKSGLVQMFANENIPVIYILNIKEIAMKNGIPVDPVTIPKVGSGDIYYKKNYPVVVMIIVICISVIVLYIYGKRTREKYD
ncbi:poly-gamma-glutamate system protein [Clostridium pascui]|uniref:poly-gamma-glutamate system protein n=1 Tax=Clostridium pascui TaxID=46609 RepID=UPI0019591A05|nr:poly-gamma-glutamate system protein [Clostridium pascui]MBM7870676.1 poly-gamma-glutamate system protein [Clostridium pascui]